MTSMPQRKTETRWGSKSAMDGRKKRFEENLKKNIPQSYQKKYDSYDDTEDFERY